MKRWSGVFIGLLLLIIFTPCALAARPKRVLILEPYTQEVAPFDEVISGFRSTLARGLGERIDIYSLPLDLARFSEPAGEGPLADFLEARIKNQPVDLVVPIGGAGAQFVARHRKRIFADTPILAVGSQFLTLPPEFLKANATLVTQKFDFTGMIEDILQIQPQTTNIAVVFGASALENFWANECRRESQPFTNRIKFSWFNNLPLPQILKQCAVLPPNIFILHLLFIVDADGIPCEKNDALRRLHQVANAPIFGYYASEFGLGIIGGRLFRDLEVGAQGAHAAIRILRGESPESIPPQVLEATTPVYDWRELQRWGISEARLPAGSVIKFRQPSFWMLYRWPVAGAILFFILQTALIVLLIVNRAKRRRREAEATLIADISSKFVNLPPGDVDREIMDAERRICELLDIDLSALWQWSGEATDFFELTHLYSAQDGPQPGGD